MRELRTRTQMTRLLLLLPLQQQQQLAYLARAKHQAGM
jgi:hypothetical protein